MTSNLELFVVAFGEMNSDTREQEEHEAIQFYRQRLAEYPRGRIGAVVSTRNLGRGADWIVVAISIASTAATGFIAIPKAHKLIRESVEEWARILNELKALFSWVVGDKPALYPDAHLFLLALFHLDQRNNASELMFQGYTRLPESNPDLQGQEPLLFSFTHGGVLEQVAVTRHGEIMWHNSVELKNVKA